MWCPHYPKEVFIEPLKTNVTLRNSQGKLNKTFCKLYKISKPFLFQCSGIVKQYLSEILLSEIQDSHFALIYWIYCKLHRSSRPEVFCKKGAPKNFTSKKETSAQELQDTPQCYVTAQNMKFSVMDFFGKYQQIFCGFVHN